MDEQACLAGDGFFSLLLFYNFDQITSNLPKTLSYLNPALNNPALGCENAVTGVHGRWRQRGSRRSTFSMDRSLKKWEKHRAHTLSTR